MKTAMRYAFEAAKIKPASITTPLVKTIIRTMEKQDAQRSAPRKGKR
jgi:hypothetical protein